MYTLYIGNKNYSSWSLRPWILLTALDIDFEEIVVPFDDGGSWHKFRQFSPTGLVPCLHDGDIVVWESLSIVEYIAETHTQAWPEDQTARAWARSATAEMHAGFHHLRNECAMTVGLRIRLHNHSAGLDQDMTRLAELWQQGLETFGGPFLAGDQFTAVDAFYAPVVFRIQTYGLQLPDAARAYVDHMLEQPAMKLWTEHALAENFREPSHEAEIRACGKWLQDLRQPAQSQLMKRRQAIGFAAAAIAAAVTPQTRLLAQMSTLAGGSDWSNARWQKAAELPIQVQELYPCVHKGELYVAGGIAARLGVPYFTNRCFAYNADTDRWREVATLPVDLHHAALVSNGRSLFCVGGFNGSYTRVWNMQDTVYELTDQGWNLVSHLPGPQAEGVLAYHPGGNVHLVTGQTPKGQANARRDDHIETSNHWHWDTAARDWSRAEPIPTARNSATGGWLGDYLVVTGGRTAQGNLNVTEIYDMQGDHWHSGAPLPLPQAGTASVVVGAGLLVFGGEIFTPQASVFANVWLYNLREDRWHAIADLPTPRHGLGAGVLNDAVYVIGGATQPGGSGTSNVNECLRR